MITAVEKESSPTPVTKPHLSVSQIKSYSMCSLRWKFSRIFTPDKVSACLVFGRAFHAALQRFYQGRLQGEPVGPDEMLAVYEEEFKQEDAPVEYGKTEDKEKLHTKAANMIAAFLANVTPGDVIAVEERIESPLAEGLPPLVGYVDLMEIRTDDDGQRKLFLVDHKTSARTPSGADDVDPDQLIHYAVAAHRSGLLSEIGLPFVLEYRVVTKTKEPKVVNIRIDPTRHDALRLIEKARRCWEGMESGVVFPNPGWQCAGCGYRKHCGRWPQQ